MLRIIGQISIFGTKESIERCASVAPIPFGKTTQIGLKRRVPDADSWCYESPWYCFHLDMIDLEVRDFIVAHSQLRDSLAVRDLGIIYAFFTLCPVGQSFEESFACVFEHETLYALSSLGLGLQIAPASAMPDAPYWPVSQTGSYHEK